MRNAPHTAVGFVITRYICVAACADERVDVFKEGHNAEDVVPDLVAAALRAAQDRGGGGGNEDEAAEMKLAELVAHELELWGHLVSGSALSEHMVRTAYCWVDTNVINSININQQI